MDLMKPPKIVQQYTNDDTYERYTALSKDTSK